MIRAKKSLGQHFLVDQNYINKIADAALQADTRVHVEIGPGGGAITGKLYEEASELVLIETDSRVIEELQSNYPEAEIHHADILKFDWGKLRDRAPIAVTGNLPYYITSPILFQLLECRDMVDQIVVMIQKEVADRILARPSTKDYGILSVQFQLFFRVDRLFNVPPTVFRPRPKVESSVIRMKPAGRAGLNVDERFLRKLIRDAFARRRKTLNNNLKGLYPVEKLTDEIRGRRAETFTPDEFVELAAMLSGTDES